MDKKQIITQLAKAQEIIQDCMDALESTGTSVTERARVPKKQVAKRNIGEIDFTLNERNFVKTYGGGLNSPKKFVLLLAYLVQGKVAQDVEVSVVMAKWSKMTSKDLLGTSYNGKYATVAKTSGWIDSKKHGTYRLHSSWMNIFS